MLPSWGIKVCTGQKKHWNCPGRTLSAKPEVLKAAIEARELGKGQVSQQGVRTENDRHRAPFLV